MRGLCGKFDAVTPLENLLFTLVRGTLVSTPTLLCFTMIMDRTLCSTINRAGPVPLLQ
jgi:hypothetical protein